jgi:hypothetical protein
MWCGPASAWPGKPACVRRAPAGATLRPFWAEVSHFGKRDTASIHFAHSRSYISAPLLEPHARCAGFQFFLPGAIQFLGNELTPEGIESAASRVQRRHGSSSLRRRLDSRSWSHPCGVAYASLAINGAVWRQRD